MVPPPNILWVLTTQWRAQACGYAGDPNACTPQLDALAAAGISYTQAVTPHPFGPFARAALLTGLPSPENGVRNYFDPLPADARTIAHALNEYDYTTAFFGKWHLAERDPGAPLVGEAHARIIVPEKRRGGFGFWEGFESGFLLNDPWLHGTRLPEPQRFTGYQSDIVCDRAAEWLSEQDAPRWFGVVSLEAPHPPYDAPTPGMDRRLSDEIILAPNVPRGSEVEAKARAELPGYYAQIEGTDRAIGRLVAAVDAAEAKRGRPAPIVVVTSAHGDMHGAHGLFRKGWPHEESVRVPLVIRRAGGMPLPPANTPVSLLDLPYWTLAWAQRKSDIVPREWVAISMPSVVALQYQCERIWRGVRTSTRKLILNADGSPWFLFDLEHDPLEQVNLALDPAHHAEIERLAKLGDLHLRA